MDSHIKVNSKLNKYISLIKTFAKTFGRDCEIVLHDLSMPGKSIIAIENGQVTGRKIGNPLTGFALDAFKKGGFGKDKKDNLINYKNITKDGKILKSSAVFIRDQNEEIIGLICINYNLTDHLMCKNLMDSFCKTIDFNEEMLTEEKEIFATGVDEVLDNIIQDAIQKVGKPISLMQKEDKLAVAKIVEEKGAFLIKGAISKLAKEIAVSRYTIYNYLEENKTKE